MIEVVNLAKQFGDVHAVRDLSFQARDGAITGLLGSNGAGKTTTLRMICGVLTPQTGCVQIDSRTVYDPLPQKRNVGALLDHTGLYSRLTTRENLEYFGRLHGLVPEALKERVEHLCTILGLDSIADRRTAGFSQGERMKTALARAMIHSPQNLVLDEPTSGLDVPSVRSLRAFLRRARNKGTCIVFSSHVLDEVRTLCDHVVIMEKGSVIAQGSPDELCGRAGSASLEDAFVHFIGRTETLPC